jgi:hypothetical protein
MKALLLHPEHDIDWHSDPPAHTSDLARDLNLDTLLDAMAGDDGFLRDVSARVLLNGLLAPDPIVYRQEALADALAHPDVVREVYAVAATAINGERRVFGSFLRSADSVLYRAVEVLDLFMGQLHQLRHIHDEHAAEFGSAAFTRFFAMLAAELDDDYFATVEEHLTQLKFRGGVQVSATLGQGLKGAAYVLREPPSRHGWLDRLTGSTPASYTYRVPDRDEAGAQYLGELRGRGINLAADALARSADHILGFFVMLRREVGFYVACANLHQLLEDKGEPTSFPEPLPSGAPVLTCRGLYDPCLALRRDEPVVGSDIDADGRGLLVVTGANEGGKSTFLRSAGLAQIMMQAGMFVAADRFSADIRDAVFTHCRREEDTEMVSGKFDEELSRMSDIAGRLTAGSFVLFNESFAATNEREGSEIARQIFRALREAGVKILCVTHLYDLASSLQELYGTDSLFLTAERRSDGTRTFRLVEGAPEPTSHGVDLYERVYGAALEPAPAPRP